MHGYCLFKNLLAYAQIEFYCLNAMCVLWSFTLEIPRQAVGCGNVNRRFVTLWLLIWHYPSSIYKWYNYSMRLTILRKNKTKQWNYYYLHFWLTHNCIFSFFHVSGASFFSGHTVYCICSIIWIMITDKILQIYLVQKQLGFKIFDMQLHSTWTTDQNYAWIVSLYSLLWIKWINP